jgi:trk system potassium uptake protein
MWARRLADLPLLILLLGGASLLPLVPAAHAFVSGDATTGRGFLYSAALEVFLWVMLAIAVSGRRDVSHRRTHGILVLIAAAVLLPAAFALPFYVTAPAATAGGAWFQMIDAFTLTGMGLYPVTGEGALPPSTQFWAALVGWTGGVLFLTAATVILAPANLGGIEVLPRDGAGLGREAGQSGIPQLPLALRFLADFARVFPAYLGLTVLLWIALMLNGVSGLGGACLAMATLSTSGIVCGETIAALPSLTGEVLIALFLVLPLSRRLLPGPGAVTQAFDLDEDPELRLGLALIVLLLVVILLAHGVAQEVQGPGLERGSLVSALWGGLFTTLSFLTTTGFVSSVWGAAEVWSDLRAPELLLMGLAIIGGGVATTAGGVKLLRVYALIRHGERELERLVHPNSVGGGGGDARRLRRQGAFRAWVYFSLFAVALAGCAFLLSIVIPSFDDVLVLSVAALTTTGPLISVAGPEGLQVASLPPEALPVLAAGMILGRIEILAFVSLLAVGGWRR